MAATTYTRGPEGTDYDFKAARSLSHPNTALEGMANLVKSCLGGGVVAIHVAYMKVGLWTAVFLNIFLGWFVAHMMVVLARTAQRCYKRIHHPALSFPELGQAVCAISHFSKVARMSKLMRYLIDATIMIDLFGSCCAYQLLIAEQLQQLIEMYTGKVIGLRMLVLALWIPCMALCMILHLKYLAWFSIPADIVLIMVAIATVVFGVQNAIAEERSVVDMPTYNNISGLFEFIGTCVFSMEGVGVTLPIENSLGDPDHIGMVLYGGMAVVISIVMTVGFFGNYGYHFDCRAPVTVNFGNTNPISIMLKFLLPAMIYVTFALNFWVPFKLVWVYFEKKEGYQANPNFWERVYKAIIVTIITIISIIFPAVTKLMGLLGSFCLSNMGFIYPAFLELLLDFDSPGLGRFKWRLIRCVFIIIFGVMLMILGTYFNAVALLTQLGYI